MNPTEEKRVRKATEISADITLRLNHRKRLFFETPPIRLTRTTQEQYLRVALFDGWPYQSRFGGPKPHASVGGNDGAIFYRRHSSWNPQVVFEIGLTGELFRVKDNPPLSRDKNIP